METAARLAILLSAPGQVIFFTWYALAAPWWRSWLGRALFTHGLSLALVLSLVDLAFLLGWAVPLWLITVTYGLVFLGIWAQLAAFAVIRFSTEGRAEKAGAWHRLVRRVRS